MANHRALITFWSSPACSFGLHHGREILLRPTAYMANRLLLQRRQKAAISTANHVGKKPDRSLSKISATLISTKTGVNDSDTVVISKLCAVMEAVADRVESHKNIGEQRDNWNYLLLTSINALTLTATTILGIASSGATGPPLVALRSSSTLMFAAALGLLAVMNAIQPSQLAEEQRNAARLLTHLHRQILTMVLLRAPTAADLEDVVERVLAIDRAYPLPLLGAMLEKFPKTMEPAVWWPPHRQNLNKNETKVDKNGWSEELEEEMKAVLEVLKTKDSADYMVLGSRALLLHKVLAISGPVLTGVATFGSALASPLGVVAGALASAVNAVEHGGQVGMVFELYRSTAGFFRLMEEMIEWNVNEGDVGRRENGEVFEMKVAVQLGRSVSELRQLASSFSSSSRNGEPFEECASKLF
ncbi:probable F-box protein At4g22030 [Malania oleifera]|uniref:probable F-box protein At4g22030 n=1 Tax=Malania oleifera TaxID=397392 RepID=UPI0025AE1214|nr:probable F-box protein At4g22030 [Malania oleifera]